MSSYEQEAIIKLMLELVQPGLSAAAPDVRRQRSYAELVGVEPLRAELVKELSSARLLSVTQDGGQPAYVNIIHESLIKNWGQLRNAIEDNRELLKRRERFRLALGDWVSNGRRPNPNYLLTGIRLAEAWELEQQKDIELKNDDAKELLHESVDYQEAAQQRELRRQRQVANIFRGAAIVATILLLIALAAGYYAFDQSGRATQEAASAVAAKKTAVA